MGKALEVEAARESLADIARKVDRPFEIVETVIRVNDEITRYAQQAETHNQHAGDRAAAEDFAKAHGKTAHDIMSRPVVSVHCDSDLNEVADLLERRRIKRVPVLKDGRLAGIIARSGDGYVILDLDGDGDEHSGWTLVYLHIDDSERIAAGTVVNAGDKLGHPSCEGGVSTGTHVHIARKYNGAWISADGTLPMELDGWITKGEGELYNGALIRGNQIVEAWDSRKDENQIQR